MISIMRLSLLIFITILSVNTAMAQKDSTITKSDTTKNTKTFSISESVTINASVDDVWKITAIGFADVGKWATAVNHSTAVGAGQGENGAVCTGRICDVNIDRFDNSTESFIYYDSTQYKFKYQIKEGLPSMIHVAFNEWTHEKTDSGTKVTMQITMSVKGFKGKLLSGLMKKKMLKDVKIILEELKYYTETGKIHPRKIKALAKYNAKKN